MRFSVDFSHFLKFKLALLSKFKIWWHVHVLCSFIVGRKLKNGKSDFGQFSRLFNIQMILKNGVYFFILTLVFCIDKYWRKQSKRNVWDPTSLSLALLIFRYTKKASRFAKYRKLSSAFICFYAFLVCHWR